MGLVDYFLKIDGIPGESTAAKQVGSIDVESFSWGAVQSEGTAGGGGTGKVSLQDFHFVARVSKASPKLFLACASGQHLKSAVLVIRRSGADQQELLRVTLSDVLVSSYLVGSSAGQDVPVDQISLNYAKIVFEYRPMKPDGSIGPAVKSGWDVKASSPA